MAMTRLHGRCGTMVLVVVVLLATCGGAAHSQFSEAVVNGFSPVDPPLWHTMLAVGDEIPMAGDSR